MSVFVDVHLKRSDETIHIKAVSEGVLRRNSAVARNQLNQAPRIGWKDVYLTATNTSRSTIMFVLDRMTRDGSKTSFNIGNRSFTEAIELYEAVEAIQIEPKQWKLERDLKRYIAEQKLLPQDVAAIVRAFGQGSSLWSHAVHHLAWWFLYNWETEEEYNALVVECEKYSALNQAILAKMTDLQRMESRKARKAAKKNAKGLVKQ